MTRGTRNSLKYLRGVPGAQSVTHGVRGTLVGFTDGTFMRIKAESVEELLAERRRVILREEVVNALLKNAGFHG